ncbi:MAG: DNA-binding response regulator, partial [Actinomycetota bacterium]|nr:DNA-binding response regulator [Actinomycetota bacterium]
MTQVVDDSLEAGREAGRRHAWRDAYELLRSADKEGKLTAGDIENLAEAAWWTGHLEEAIALRERAYREYLEAGETLHAAGLAVMVSIDHANRAAMAVASGWLARAERLLANEEESVAHGHLALAHGMGALDMGELGTAAEEFDRAHEIGTRFGDRNLEAMAMVFKGTVLVSKGEVTEGLALLDEATAAAVCGELQPLATGIVYCITIHSCQA